MKIATDCAVGAARLAVRGDEVDDHGVLAGAAVDQVLGAIARVERVVAGSAAQGVREGATRDAVVAGLPKDN